MNAVSFIAPRLDDTAQRLLFKIASYLYAGLGLAGVDVITTTAAQVGNWWIYHALTDSVIGAITYSPGFSTGVLAGQTVRAGDRLYGPITNFQLTSGTGILVRAAIVA